MSVDIDDQWLSVRLAPRGNNGRKRRGEQKGKRNVRKCAKVTRLDLGKMSHLPLSPLQELFHSTPARAPLPGAVMIFRTFVPRDTSC